MEDKQRALGHANRGGLADEFIGNAARHAAGKRLVIKRVEQAGLEHALGTVVCRNDRYDALVDRRPLCR